MDDILLNEGFRVYYENQGRMNNRCSGYALAAILCEMGILSFCPDKERAQPLGVTVYEKLCKQQEALLQDEACTSTRFVNALPHISNGTRMILPSSIVHYCASLGLQPGLFCSSRRDTIFQTEVFEEDCRRLPGLVHTLRSYAAFERQARKHGYLMALTRYKHWVALKFAGTGFYLFDPAPSDLGGGRSGPGGFAEMLPLERSVRGVSGKINYFFELMIGLSCGI